MLTDHCQNQTTIMHGKELGLDFYFHLLCSLFGKTLFYSGKSRGFESHPSKASDFVFIELTQECTQVNSGVYTVLTHIGVYG